MQLVYMHMFEQSRKWHDIQPEYYMYTNEVHNMYFGSPNRLQFLQAHVKQKCLFV